MDYFMCRIQLNSLKEETYLYTYWNFLILYANNFIKKTYISQNYAKNFMNSTVISLKSAIISEWKYEQTASGTHIQ